MDKRKILESKVPYIELFGVDGMGKGRPGNDTPAAELLPRLELPLMGDQATAMQIRQQARTRAITVLKTVFAKEFVSIYEKEVRHIVQTRDRAKEAEGSTSGSGVAVPEGAVGPVADGPSASRNVESDGVVVRGDSTRD